MTTTTQVAVQPLAHAAFCSSADFSHAVHLTPVLSPRDSVHLRLTTQWHSARNPSELHTAYAVTLQPQELQSLIEALQQGLARHLAAQS
jgi:hypothetical protein